MRAGREYIDVLLGRLEEFRVAEMEGDDPTLSSLGAQLAERVMSGGRLFVSGADTAVPSEAQNVAQGLWMVNRHDPRPAGPQPTQPALSGASSPSAAGS